MDRFGVRDTPPCYLLQALQALGITDVFAIASDASYKGLPSLLGDAKQSNVSINGVSYNCEYELQLIKWNAIS